MLLLSSRGSRAALSRRCGLSLLVVMLLCRRGGRRRLGTRGVLRLLCSGSSHQEWNGDGGQYGRGEKFLHTGNLLFSDGRLET